MSGRKRGRQLAQIFHKCLRTEKWEASATKNKSGVLVFWAECLRDALPSSSLSGAIVNNSHWEQEVHKGWQWYSADRQRSRALKKAPCVGGEKVYSLQQLTHSSPLLSAYLREREAGTQSAATCDATMCALHAGRISHKEDVRVGKEFKEGIFQQSGDTVGIPRCHGLRVSVCVSPCYAHPAKPQIITAGSLPHQDLFTFLQLYNL